MSNNTPLDLCTMDDIMDELRTRFPGGVLVVTNCEAKNSPQEEGTVAYWGGGRMTGVGLAVFAQDRLLNADRRIADDE